VSETSFFDGQARRSLLTGRYAYNESTITNLALYGAMKLRGWSVNEVARKAGIAHDTVVRALRNDSRLTAQSKVKIAEVFQTDSAFLFEKQKPAVIAGLSNDQPTTPTKEVPA